MLLARVNFNPTESDSEKSSLKTDCATDCLVQKKIFSCVFLLQLETKQSQSLAFWQLVFFENYQLLILCNNFRKKFFLNFNYLQFSIFFTYYYPCTMYTFFQVNKRYKQQKIKYSQQFAIQYPPRIHTLAQPATSNDQLWCKC